MSVDSLSGIFEFSKVKERRNLSCISSLFKETFDASRKECTKISMRNLVEERRERYEFPLVTSKHQTVKECLPKGYRGHHQMRHLEQHAMKILQHDFDINITFDDLISTIRENKSSYGIFLKLAATFFLKDKDPRMTLETLYAKYSQGGDRLYYIDQDIESKVPLWEHVDGLEDTCDNQNRDDTLELYISILLDCFV